MTELPTPSTPSVEETKQKQFQDMFEKFAIEAREKTGYALLPQIGPNGAFNTLTKLPTDDSTK